MLEASEQHLKQETLSAHAESELNTIDRMVSASGPLWTTSANC